MKVLLIRAYAYVDMKQADMVWMGVGLTDWSKQSVASIAKNLSWTISNTY